MRKTTGEAEVSIPFRTESDATALLRALRPEVASSRTSRASVHVKRRKRLLTLKFVAKDLIALRAMLNSYLRFTATWKRVCEDLSYPDKDIQARDRRMSPRRNR